MALVFLLLPWAGPVSALGVTGGPASGVDIPAPLPPLLWMRAGAFDPAARMPDVPAPLLVPTAVASPASVDTGGRVHFILQFDAPVTPFVVEALAGRGVTYERYLPDDGMIASAPLSRAPRAAQDVGARALIALAPAFKLEPALWEQALAPPGGDLLLTVLVFDTPAALGALASKATVLAFDGRAAFARAPASSLLDIARLGDVEWVESYGDRQVELDQTTRILAARQDADGAFMDDGRSVWSYNDSTDTFEGLTGRGVTVAIADTGVDETHPGFEGRLVASYEPPGLNATNDTAGHGTHVAGIVAGNGSWRDEDTNRTDGQYAGLAPEAGLVAQISFTLLRTDTQRAQDALAAGAFINSNSWSSGCCGAYTGGSQTYDELTLDANGRDPGSPPMLFVFASGNAGPGSDTGVSPGTAKNVITAGSVGNTPTAANSVSGFSSRGPTDDGRLKPDLVAPGAGVTSARSVNSGCGGGYGGCSYLALSGTSMSTPAISGSAALVTQWYRDTHGAMPSPAMVKASLIAGATPLPGYNWPDFNQGWGRVNVSRTVNEGPAFRHLAWDEDTSLSMAGVTNQTFRFFSGGDEELKVVLVWSDVPGTTSATKALINDLDLEVRAPDGTLLRGNAIQGGYSVEGTARDSGNNTEVVRVRAPARGIWQVTVRAVNVPSGGQRFALVAQGNVTDRWVTVEPAPAQFLPATPREDDPLTVIVPVVNTGTQASGGMDVTATLSGPEGDQTETVHLLGVQRGDDLPAVFHFSPKRGSHTLRVTVDPGGTSGDLLPADNSRQDPLFVRGFEVALQVLSAPANVTPLGSSPFVVRVVNRGNVVDDVHVTASGPPGWGLGMNVSGSYIQPGQSAFISGAVVAPERALAGEVAVFNFTATSGGNTSRAASIDVPVGVDPFVSLRLSAANYSGSVYPGGRALFSFLAENAGNVEVDLTLAVALDGGAPPGWDAHATASTLTIAPYSNATGTVEVTAPAGASASEVRTITLQPSSPQVGSVSPLVFQVFVERVRGFHAAVNATQQFLEAGTQATFEGTVTNSGNGREYFSVALTPAPEGVDRVLWAVTSPSLAVEPGSSGRFEVTVWALQGGPAGDSSATLSVSAEGSTPYAVVLSATVIEQHALGVTAPPRIVMPQGTAYAAGVTVTNDGNVPETVVLEVSGAESGVRVEGFEGTLTLAPGQSHQVKARVVADAAAPPGSATVHLVARSSSSGTLSQADLAVEVTPAASTSTPFLPGAGAGAAVAALAAVGAVAASVAGRRPRGR